MMCLRRLMDKRMQTDGCKMGASVFRMMLKSSLTDDVFKKAE